jgi:hypothetical protein
VCTGRSESAGQDRGGRHVHTPPRTPILVGNFPASMSLSCAGHPAGAVTSAANTCLDRMKNIDTSVSGDAPAAAADTLTDSDLRAAETMPSPPPAEPGDDGATTPGGPTMILLLTGSFLLVCWLRRRWRRRHTA